MKDPLNLIWIDLEMTGLSPNHDRIIEIATVVTDKDLNILGEGPVYAVNQSQALLDGMDEWNTHQHGTSGLIERVQNSQITETEAEAKTIEFLSEFLDARQSPMCGNSICLDRRFLSRYMPDLEAFFHYRNLDVSTLKELQGAGILVSLTGSLNPVSIWPSRIFMNQFMSSNIIRHIF